MSLHRSLKTKPSALNQHRNVLTRAERITRLAEAGRFETGTNAPIGLVKVASRQVVAGKKKKSKEEDGADAGAAAKPAAKPAGKK